ncbi:MAG: anthranilate phosphoribosyltransferase, partial [Anaerolineales bacterium]
DAKYNAEIIKKILNNDKSKKRDIVLLNAAAGIIVGKKADNFKEGIEIAKESIESGKAIKILEEMIKFSNKI